MIGSAFCFPDCDCFFIVVREHPDDPNLYLVVPACNCTLVGTTDLFLDTSWGPTIVHCGYSQWVSRSVIKEANTCLDTEQVKKVRQLLHSLATNQTARFDGNPNVVCDPNYEDHCDELAKWTSLIGSAELESIIEDLRSGEPNGNY